ncbi:iron-sulfur cluster co-chaperone protein HscB [Thrips palmi]|uniref:Iron-sulfur cluster co-chaperone protein HscB n=1 Tax=Thrips palmi TaxID=161013 RepID=A0A6P8ZPA3_THRPL|nr:iron-sulfur cluster co-chaperone protein HscB [Thrips palmi]
MSLTFRLFSRNYRSALLRIISCQNSYLRKGSGPCRLQIHQSQFTFCENYCRTYASKVNASPCWKCGKSGREARFFCKDCNALQKPNKNYNYFHLLDLSETFDVDSSEVSKKFRQLQAVLHPDKFSNASDDEKEFSAELSSLVNKAFRTLSNPLERGLYLLQLHNTPILEENTSFNKEFLFEIMELNEELESISNLNELKTFHSKNREVLKSIQKKVSELFTGQDIPKARTALMEMKYYVTLEEKIKEKLLQLEATN